MVLLRNRLKYALTYQEVIKIVNQKLIKVDNKVRTDKNYPAGFMGKWLLRMIVVVSWLYGSCSWAVQSFGAVIMKPRVLLALRSWLGLCLFALPKDRTVALAWFQNWVGHTGVEKGAKLLLSMVSLDAALCGQVSTRSAMCYTTSIFCRACVTKVHKYTNAPSCHANWRNSYEKKKIFFTAVVLLHLVWKVNDLIWISPVQTISVACYIR